MTLLRQPAVVQPADLPDVCCSPVNAGHVTPSSSRSFRSFVRSFCFVFVLIDPLRMVYHSPGCAHSNCVARPIAPAYALFGTNRGPRVQLRCARERSGGPDAVPSAPAPAFCVAVRQSAGALSVRRFTYRDGCVVPTREESCFAKLHGSGASFLHRTLPDGRSSSGRF